MEACFSRLPNRSTFCLSRTGLSLARGPRSGKWSSRWIVANSGLKFAACISPTQTGFLEFGSREYLETGILAGVVVDPHVSRPLQLATTPRNDSQKPTQGGVACQQRFILPDGSGGVAPEAPFRRLVYNVVARRRRPGSLLDCNQGGPLQQRGWSTSSPGVRKYTTAA